MKHLPLRSIFWSSVLALLPCITPAEPHPFDARPQPWQRLDEPILSALTTKQSWNKVVTYSPTVIHHSGKFRMWYIGSSTVTRRANADLGYAESDDGTTWREHKANPILTGNEVPWGTLIHTPNVLFDSEESLYKMWFVSGTPQKFDERGRVVELDQQLGYAESRDGLRWDVHPKPIYESGRSPSVIKIGPGKYRMWMGSRPSPGGSPSGLLKNFYEFTSEDGIHWNRGEQSFLQPSGKARAIVYPYVIRDGAGYFMWYAGHLAGTMTGIFSASSTDGTHWKVDHEHLAFPPRSGKSGFDSRYTSTPCVLAMPDRYLLYYSARDWITEYTDGAGAKHRDGASPAAHIGVAVISR